MEPENFNNYPTIVYQVQRRINTKVKKKKEEEWEVIYESSSPGKAWEERKLLDPGTGEFKYRIKTVVTKKESVAAQINKANRARPYLVFEIRILGYWAKQYKKPMSVVFTKYLPYLEKPWHVPGTVIRVSRYCITWQFKDGSILKTKRSMQDETNN